MKHSFVNLELERALWSQGFAAVAGVDEAGRGPLAGPVVAAAVMFPQDLLLDDVNDSKQCTPRQREQLFAVIMEQALSVGIGMVDHEEIDRINILQATVLAMRKSLEHMTVQPEYAIVDGNSFRHETLRFRNVIKGDQKSFTIAAASIVAKVTRDRLMCEFDARFPQYGFARHKGYGTRQHIEAIRRYGFCDIHRRSFHPAALREDTAPV